MSGRIAEVFRRLHTNGQTGLVTYVTGGDPDLARSADVLRALDRAGADVIEVGVPFSDPLADGPVIQRASERALAVGATLSNVLELVGRLRSELTAAIVLFTYANPVFRMGSDHFAERAAAALCWSNEWTDVHRGLRQAHPPRCAVSLKNSIPFAQETSMWSPPRLAPRR